VLRAEEVNGQGKSLKAIDRQTSETCPEATSGASQTGQCKNGKCDVWIGGSNFCSECSTASEYLINGKCTADNTESACEGGQPSAGVCTSCAQGFFMHRGGCYQIGTEPGNLVCKDTTASTNQGTCDACQAGYFRNPVTGLDKTKESCIACNETIAVDYNTGVANCAECIAPVTSGSSGSNQKATCTACAGGYFISGDGSACTACNDGTNGVADCTACVPREDNPAKAKCTACSGSKKPSLDGKSCNACTDINCAFCNSERACQKCDSGYILDGAACTQQTCSTPDCKTCTNPKAPNEICTACVSNYYLTPTSQCIADCAALSGYYGRPRGRRRSARDAE
ncbi:Variant-specific surface protein, partial [Giardia duodenalis]